MTRDYNILYKDLDLVGKNILFPLCRDYDMIDTYLERINLMGINPELYINNMYFNDTIENNLNVVKYNISRKYGKIPENIMNKNILLNNCKYKYDLVILEPPFEDHNSEKYINIVMNILSCRGICKLILPKTFLYHKKYDNIKKQFINYNIMEYGDNIILSFTYDDINYCKKRKR